MKYNSMPLPTRSPNLIDVWHWSSTRTGALKAVRLKPSTLKSPLPYCTTQRRPIPCLHRPILVLTSRHRSSAGLRDAKRQRQTPSARPHLSFHATKQVQTSKQANTDTTLTSRLESIHRITRRHHPNRRTQKSKRRTHCEMDNHEKCPRITDLRASTQHSIAEARNPEPR